MALNGFLHVCTDVPPVLHQAPLYLRT